MTLEMVKIRHLPTVGFLKKWDFLNIAHLCPRGHFPGGILDVLEKIRGHAHE